MKEYEFSKLYTTIPFDELKTRVFHIINSCLFEASYSKHYFVKHHPDVTYKFSEVDFFKCWSYTLTISSQHLLIKSSNSLQVLEFRGYKLCSMLVDLFLYYYEGEFGQTFLLENKKYPAVASTSTLNILMTSYPLIIIISIQMSIRTSEIDTKNTKRLSRLLHTCIFYLTQMLKANQPFQFMTNRITSVPFQPI